MLSAIVVAWLGISVVDSLSEAIALLPLLALLSWLTSCVWQLSDERAVAAQRHSQLAELHAEMLAHLELAQLRVDALALMEFRVVWLSASELELLSARVTTGRVYSQRLSTWLSIRKRLAFLPLRGLDERTARVWPLDIQEALSLCRSAPRTDAVASIAARIPAAGSPCFAPALTDGERSGRH